ncbi:Kinase, CMGC CDK [Giardia muris]|uniref:Kinase, CMGC CDK n=1 Tax=Giardia muris TaxID=5742 RepID=A0A4Z1SVJ4_GIAMU|nr:Kinase, CMGC CDK [Giardia muris]|eukprot:TNJ29816.1 Kinase, CMGC CDK [Giardia muris]
MSAPQPHALPNDYVFIEQIGEGTYGTVCKCAYGDQLLAVKRIKMDSSSKGVPATTLREVAILKALNTRQREMVEQGILHDLGAANIINLIDVIYDLSNIFLVFEYCSIDLDQYLKTNVLSQRQIKRLMYQLLNGLNVVHKNEILHRDIKPNNLLLKFPHIQANGEGDTGLNFAQTRTEPRPEADDCILKLTDFGLARSYGINVTSISANVVSLWYRAPELILSSKSYSTAVDVWSTGCIMYFLANRKALFQVRKDFDLLQQAFSYFYTGPASVREISVLPGWSSFVGTNQAIDLGALNNPDRQRVEVDIVVDDQGKDLFYKMMCLNPSQRISCEEALHHPWFADKDA